MHLWILQRLDLQTSDVSFDQVKIQGSCSANFRFPCLKDFKGSTAAQKWYCVLSSFVHQSKETSQSISVLSEFVELATLKSEVQNSSSISHCKFVGVDKKTLPFPKQFSIADSFQHGSWRYLQIHHALHRCSGPKKTAIEAQWRAFLKITLQVSEIYLPLLKSMWRWT